LDPSENRLPAALWFTEWLTATLSITLTNSARSLCRPIIIVGSMKNEETSFEPIFHSFKASQSPSQRNCWTLTKSCRSPLAE
jgi:hypothetical protein